MAGGMRQVLGRLYGLAGPRDSATPDQQLLERFLRSGDADAFAALVQRHGGLVWGVCRRVMAHEQDAEDTFQAVFMVLARKARTIRSKEALGPWLYRVAYHLGVKARGRQARRREREREAMAAEREQARDVEPPDSEPLRRELLASLDRELSQLPARYRAAVVLCDLQGKSHEEAARELDCPLGSMSRQLQRGRELLRERLVGRGIALSAATLGACLADTARASAPAALMQQTIRNSVQFAAGGSVDDAARPAADLASGALRSMSISKFKMVAACVAVVLIGAWVAIAAVAPVDPIDPTTPAPAGKVIGKAKSYGPFEIRLIANQSRYEVNLGGQSPKDFRTFLETTDGPKPPPAAIDMVLEIKNTSDKPARFWSGGDPVRIDWKLTGPDAVSIASDRDFTADFRLQRATELKPGETYRFELKSLAAGFRGQGQYSYWLSPGTYQLAATLHTALAPKLEGSQDAGDGFGRATLTTEPVALTVIAGKGGKLDKPVRPQPRPNGNNGVGGQGGGFVPGRPVEVQPDQPAPKK
ncbi:MAG: RNA polymerase sigma factor [Gemmataceae bacterium]